MSEPQLQRISRRFGRYDSWKYERIFLDSSLAEKSIEHVTIDCRFRLEKSKWGVLTDARHPGGIIYLDFNFHQPGNHRLEHATITVTLDDDSDALIRHLPATRPVGPTNERGNTKMPIHIGDYGPTQIVGAAKSAYKIVEHQAAPEVGVGDFINIGNMGRRSEKNFNQEYRWTFSSQKKPAKRDSPYYKVLKWTITENKLDPHSYHSNTIHTAFAFRHGAQPFLIRVKIEGSLRNKWSNFWHKFSSVRDRRFATTLVNFNGSEKFTKVLDQIAQGLPYEMEMENVLKAPAEAKGPQKPTYSFPPPPGFGGSQELKPPHPVDSYSTNNDTQREKVSRHDLASENSILEALADAFESVSGSYKLPRGQDSLTQQHTHTRLSGSKLDVDDENIVGRNSAQRSNERLVSGEQEKNQNGTAQPAKVSPEHQEAIYELKTGFSDITKALKVPWKLLLQYTLQVLGLISIMSVVVKRMTDDN
ncbi:hypothetical protein O1611_g6553 [Lasiodiplodia mahajangana]|uniref:Uncharacterized protein n=1 Tax=Lasiodiplodia mahajangana TaxID=1108764 RepID=A0ACC2JHW5_9PEZI|nr:hypothetical protein O1611_g6553 [Lasiodiplodia mahajangana]